MVWLSVEQSTRFTVDGLMAQGQTEFEQKKFFEHQALMKGGLLAIEEQQISVVVREMHLP